MDKAKINAAVKQIKKLRQSDGGKAQDKPSPLQLSSKPEKLMLGLGLAAGLAILFDDGKKRRKNPKKARPFYHRCYDNYKKLDSLLDSTVARDLKKQAQRQFEDDELENMQIEKGIPFDI